jgi:hypothetical protein
MFLRSKVTRYVQATHYYLAVVDSIKRQMARHQYDHELDVFVLAWYNNLEHCYACHCPHDQDKEYMQRMCVSSQDLFRQSKAKEEYQFFLERLHVGLYHPAQSPMVPSA